MKPTDLDDATPVEPDDETLSRVRARSGSFRRRRNAQRFVTVASGVLVVALAVGIAFARVSSDDSRPAGPTTTTTTTPTVTIAALAGPWSPVTIASYGGPLTDPPLSWVPRLAFKADGTFVGSDGCNDVSGSYQLGDDGSFDVRSHFSTAVGCRQKVPLFDVLYAATRVTVSDDRLELFAPGRELAIFGRPDITARVELPSDTITAGSSVTAQVVVQNDTGQPVHASGCVSYFQVLLHNDDVQQVPLWLHCLQSFTFPVGESRHRAMVSASYNSCTASRDQSAPPSCLPDNDPPPLPPGDYRATLFQSGDAVTAPPPITVHVVTRS